VRGYRSREALNYELDAALALRPDLVTVFIGGNDVLLNVRFDRARFADELERLVAPLARPEVTMVMSTVPDLTARSLLLPPLRGQVRRRVEAVNAVIRKVSHRHDTALLDAWYEPETREHWFWSVDRIHPSAEGHQVIAASVAALLGVPVETANRSPASGGAVLRRYAGEAAWLARYGLRVPARGLRERTRLPKGARAPL
jgi:lysophospholipase L1-like esterase